jgi:hypothetical protein
MEGGASLANTGVRTITRPDSPDFLPVVSSARGASRIGAALTAREFSRAIRRKHSSGRDEMIRIATFAAALARLAVAEDITND